MKRRRRRRRRRRRKFFGQCRGEGLQEEQKIASLSTKGRGVSEGQWHTRKRSGSKNSKGRVSEACL